MRQKPNDLFLLQSIRSQLPKECVLFGENRLKHLIDTYQEESVEPPILTGGEATELGSLIELFTALVEFGTAYLAYKATLNEHLIEKLSLLQKKLEKSIGKEKVEKLKNELDNKDL